MRPLFQPLESFVLVLFVLLPIFGNGFRISGQCPTPGFKILNRSPMPEQNLLDSKIADFNGDGKIDFAGLDAANGKLFVMINDGAGNFGAPIFKNVGAHAKNFITGDLNGDNRTDVVVWYYDSQPSGVTSATSFINNGTGGFTTSESTILRPYETIAALGFINNDARSDLITYHSGSGFYRPGLNANSFAPPISAPVGVIGDYNGDGKTDFARTRAVFPDPNNRHLEIYLNDGNGVFTLQPTQSVGVSELYSAADLNNDGRSDFIFGNPCGGPGGDIRRVSVLLSNSAGNYANVGFDFYLYSACAATTIGDFNGDGKLDLLVTNYQLHSPPYTFLQYSVLLNNGNNSFARVDIPGRSPDPALVADFNGDGKSDSLSFIKNPYFPIRFLGLEKNICRVPGQTKTVDFDADGRAELALWNPADGLWRYKKMYFGESVSLAYWGSANFGDVPTPGDYDGDFRTDVAVWRATNGVWYVRQSSDNSLLALQWGTNGDKPVAGDYDGDQKTDVAVYRNGFWYVRQSSNNQLLAYQFGLSSDKPVPADYDGDDKTDVAVFRPGNGFWYVLKSSDGQLHAQQWGTSEDKLVPGDYDGDGKFDFAVFRPSSRYWHILSSHNNAIFSFPFGLETDVPTPGIYAFDDTQKTFKIAVYRPQNGGWYILDEVFPQLVYQRIENFSGGVPVSTLYRVE